MKQKFFRDLVYGSRFKLIVLSVLGAGASACGVYLAWISKSVVDMATGQAAGNLLYTGLLLAAVILFQLGLQTGLTFLHVHTAVSIRFRLQSLLFDKLLHKQKLSVDRFHSGELVNRLSGDTQIVADGVAEILPSLVSVSSRIIFSVAALVLLDPPLAVLCLLAGMLMLVAAHIYRKKTGDIFKKCRESEGRIRSFIQESAQNMAVIKAFSVQSIISRQLGMAQKNSYNLILKRGRLSIGVNVCFYVAMTAGYYAVLAWGAWRIFKGYITFGTLTAILGLTGDVTTPFRQIAALFPQYMSVCASADRLEELDGLPDDNLPQIQDSDLIHEDTELIRLDDVCFSYGDSPVLKSASVEFRKGILTAVTGESGAGKSTLLSLMTGVLGPMSGRISLVTGTGESLEIGPYRRMFAYVPQEFLLLSGDVVQNITLFDESPDSDRLKAAIEIAELTDVIAELPDGLDTFLGEGGGRLSGGQRQRMAIARAIYSGAEILLMDESTSALSDSTEERILNNLRKCSKTVIFVTHRKTAVRLCDEVYNVSDGAVTKTR